MGGAVCITHTVKGPRRSLSLSFFKILFVEAARPQCFPALMKKDIYIFMLGRVCLFCGWTLHLISLSVSFHFCHLLTESPLNCLL